MAGHTPDTQRAQAESKAAFLTALAERITVSAACKSAGVGRATVYDWRQQDEEFAVAWADVDAENVERLEAEAFRRAHDGVTKKEKRDENGDIVFQEREYSDSLLMFLLKARRPEVYRDRATIEHTGAEGGPVRVESSFDLSRLSRDELRQLHELQQRASESPGD